jgi:hypothetical protein
MIAKFFGERGSRRAFLSATGAVAVGLPLLEAFDTKHAQAAVENRRFFAFYVPNGKWMQSFTPVGTGPNFTLSPTLEPLAPLKHKVFVPSGLFNRPANFQRDDEGGHLRGTGSFLNATRVPGVGISLDQRIAQDIGGTTRLPSLALGIHNEGCDSGGCVQIRNISYDAQGNPITKLSRPEVAFDQVFAGSSPVAGDAEADKRRALRTSVLDYIGADADALEKRVGGADKLRLQQYLTSVRELERQVQAISSPGSGSCAVGTRPDPNHEWEHDLPLHIRTMLDISALALACGATRIISFMMGNGGDGALSFPHIGVPQHHHYLAHHASAPDKVAALKLVDRWEVGELMYLLSAMDKVDEVGGTLLDNTIVYYSSEISDGNLHNYDNMPIVLSGGGSAFRLGRHEVYSGDPVANLFVSIANAMGVPLSSFGEDGTGPLPNLS